MTDPADSSGKPAASSSTPPGQKSALEILAEIKERSRSRASAAKRFVADTQKSVEAPSTRRTGRDRSFIVWSVILTFVGITLMLTIFAATGSWTEREQSCEFILKVLGSVLLPVVTLVIGYYFGKEKAQQ